MPCRAAAMPTNNATTDAWIRIWFAPCAMPPPDLLSPAAAAAPVEYITGFLPPYAGLPEQFNARCHTAVCVLSYITRRGFLEPPTPYTAACSCRRMADADSAACALSSITRACHGRRYRLICRRNNANRYANARTTLIDITAIYERIWMPPAPAIWIYRATPPPPFLYGYICYRLLFASPPNNAPGIYAMPGLVRRALTPPNAPDI